MKNQKVVSAIVDGIIDYLKNTKQEDLLPEIVNYLRKLDDSKFALVSSARDLSSKEKNEVKNLFKKLTGEIPEKISFSKDEKLIDGLLLSYKHKQWDFSLLGQVNTFAKK